MSQELSQRSHSVLCFFFSSSDVGQSWQFHEPVWIQKTRLLSEDGARGRFAECKQNKHTPKLKVKSQPLANVKLYQNGKNVSCVDLKHGCFLVPAMFLHVCDIAKEKVGVFLALEQILGLKRVDKSSPLHNFQANLCLFPKVCISRLAKIM